MISAGLILELGSHDKEYPLKLSPYTFKDMPQELIDFKDEVTTLINYGKYQVKVLIEGTPTWGGVEGELAICYISSAGGTYEFRDYYFLNSAWRWRIAVGTTI